MMRGITILLGRLRGHRIIVDGLWSLSGSLAPLVAAIFAVPALLGELGVAKFGLLSLAWVIVGYFSLFDLGLGRALTHLVAKRIEVKQQEEIPLLVGAAGISMLALGVLAAVTLFLLASPLVNRWLNLEVGIREEALFGFYILAIAVPVLMVSSGLKAILEGFQRFDLVNAIRVPFGVAMYIAPVVTLSFSKSLPTIFLSLLVVRVLNLGAHLLACVWVLPFSWREIRPVKAGIFELIGFGGWMTVSNLVGPVLLYAGRFMLAFMVSAEAVAYFSTPYDMAINLLIIPGVVVSVLIPHLVRAFERGVEEVERIYKGALLITGLAVFPLCLVAYLMAFPGLSWWLGEEFARESFRVAQLLSVGIFLNSFGHISQCLVQCYGRPDLTAKLHMAEVATYLPYLAIFINLAGIEGAASAWVLRVLVSTVMLAWIARRCLMGRVARRY